MGQTVVLTRHGRPVAKLVPVAGSRGPELRPGMGEVNEHIADYDVGPAAIVSSVQARQAALMRLLEKEIWPQIPPDLVGRGPTKKEREGILGIDKVGS